MTEYSEFSELMTEALFAEAQGNSEQADELMTEIEELEEAEAEAEEDDLSEREKVNLEMREDYNELVEDGKIQNLDEEPEDDDEDNPAVVELEAGKRAVMEYHDHVRSVDLGGAD